MDAVAGVFPDTPRARRAVMELQRSGCALHTTLLCPGTRVEEVLEQVPVDDTEKPGMGGAVSSVVGGVVGMTAVSLLFPGVGPVVVAGMLAGGVAGAATGLGIGQQAERHLSLGLTRDEVDVYGGALRAGKAVVIAGAETAGDVDAIRDTMRAAGAERVDPARAGGLADLLEPPGTQVREAAHTSQTASPRK